jgi:tryptophan-rich sensory protein
MNAKNRHSSLQVVILAALLALCAAAAALGSAFTMSAMDGWYQDLRQPEWNPPVWVFGPVWTVLHAGMAIAAWLVWRKRGWGGASRALSVIGLQLALNVLWTAFFFGEGAWAGRN